MTSAEDAAGHSPHRSCRDSVVSTVDDTLSREVLRFRPEYSLEETLDYLRELRLASPGHGNVLPTPRKRVDRNAGGYRFPRDGS